jgi:cholesterol transport system auxiliary component
MTIFPTLVQAVALTALLALPGCGALSSLSGASEPLDAYALTPLEGPGDARGSRHVVIEVPTTSGAIATNRILIKPNPLQAAYLPGAAWTTATPEMVQTLLVQSMQASGAFRLVGRTSLGLFPDYTVLTEIRAFQAEPGPLVGPAYVVRIALTMTMLREADGALVASRSFEASAGAESASPLVLASAFDAAMGVVLRDAVPWIANVGVGRV